MFPLKKFIKLIIEKKEKELLKGDDEDEDEDIVDEFSAIGGGSISGYTAPLGSTPKGGRTKMEKPWKASERAFGGGKRYKIKNYNILNPNGRVSPKIRGKRHKNPYDPDFK